MWRALRALPRTVWLIGLISLVNDSASEMLYPLIPLYLASVLMSGPRVLGFIEGVAEATSSLLKLFSGVVVDRTRRSKPWIVFGYALAGLGRPLIAFVGSWPWLFVIRFSDRVGKGLRTSPRDALLAASAGPERRGLAFGVHRAMDNAGAVIGPVLAAALLGTGLALRDVFLWSFVPGVLCLALSLAIREPAQPLPRQARRTRWKFGELPPLLRRYLAVVALFTLGNSSNMFLLLRARELGLTEAQVPLLWAGVSAVAMLLSTPLSGLSDRFGRKRFLVGGYLAYAAVYLALARLRTDGAEMLVLYALYGVFLGATEGVEKAMVADLAPADGAGAAFGWFNLVAGIMLLPASLLFGWLYQTFSARLAFSVSGSLALAAAALLLGWVRSPARA
jgi:MFS family permease